ncbi:MAG TPA: hypothetical protein VLM79_31705 [Kofleriaceae bacterium]|nr:hypothetical protein [Kofleriaceae bacterium]
MTDRSRRPTDKIGERFEGDVASRPTLQVIDDAAATRVDLPQSGPRPIEQATPTEVTARAERSEPLRMISMKDASAPRKPRTDERRAVKVQLRSIAEARRHDTPPVGLGHLAPPRDPKKARNRRLVDNVIWGCIAIMLACAIMLAIWLVAGR